MNTCLVTGVAGFIGSHLAARLIADGWGVLGVDNLSLGRRTNIEPLLQHERFTFVEADLSESGHCLAILRKAHSARQVKVAWHLAANSNIPTGTADPGVDLKDTFLTTFGLVDILRKLGIPELLFCSTSAVFGEKEGLLEEESVPLHPISYYGAMKLAGEALIHASLTQHLKRGWVFRFPNVVGSHATHGVILDFARKLRQTPQQLEVLGDGTQQKPYLHVSELVDAMIYAFEHARDSFNCFHIGPRDNTTTTVRAIAEKVVKKMSPGARICFGSGQRGWVGDIPRFNYSIERLRRLGWSPRLTSDEAVEKAIDEIILEVRHQS